MDEIAMLADILDEIEDKDKVITVGELQKMLNESFDRAYGPIEEE